MELYTELEESLRTENPCWKGYHPVGTKKKNGRTVPNCVPNANENIGESQDDPIVVITDKNTGKYLDKLSLSAAAEKYKLNAQSINTQLAHQDYTTIGNYTIAKPMGGQPTDQPGMGESLDGITVEMKNGARFKIRSISNNPVKQILSYFIRKRDFNILKNISKIDNQDVTNIIDQILHSGSVSNITKNESITEKERDGDIQDKQVKNMVRAARSAHPDASDDEAIALYLDDKERYDFTFLNHEEEDLETQVQHLQKDSSYIRNEIEELKHIIAKLNRPNSP